MADVFTFGEAMIRFSVSAGERLETAPSFAVDVAGSEANVACALAQIGRSVVWWSRLPDDPLGRRVRRSLAAADVDCSEIVLEDSGRIGTYFVELHPPPLPTSVIYDRAGSLASQMSPSSVPWLCLEATRWVHVSGITPALSASCLDTTRAVVERAREAGIGVSFDVNYRAKLWSVRDAAPVLAELAQAADVVVCTREDAARVFEIAGPPDEVCNELARLSEAIAVVVTDGGQGAWWRQGSEAGHVDAVAVTVVDRLGAGDAFAAGVIDGMLDGDLETGVRRGAALAAVALATRGDQILITQSELEALLGGDSTRVDR